MTEQERREKVIKGFECCDTDDCDNCPYFRSDDENDLGTCKATLHRDALALLKAQEPRVMTLDEVVALQEGKGDVWIEATEMPGIPPWIIAATLTEKTDWQELGALWFSDDQYHYVTDYNLNTADGWRCWTSRPDEKRRAEMPWN